MYKVIACGIFQPYINQLSLSDQYDWTFLKIRQHNQPKQLTEAIQNEINQSLNYEKIIILYGVCGGALLPLYTKDIPLVIVRVHDCMSILLGSKQRYDALTQQNKSLNWSCYALKKDHYVNDTLSKWEELYDEETIEYLKSILIPEKDFYISFDMEEEKEYLHDEENILKGDLSFLNDILHLNSSEILYVYPHQRIKQTLDEEVIKVVND